MRKLSYIKQTEIEREQFTNQSTRTKHNSTLITKHKNKQQNKNNRKITSKHTQQHRLQQQQSKLVTQT